MSGGLSRATVTAVALTCKAFLNLGYCASVTVNGLPILLDAMNSDERNKGRGIVTVANHLSTLDDPLVWGLLPWRSYLKERTTRWALGASDIMFTNPFFSTFFRHGQVLETFRGNGIYQEAVDVAIEKLNQGGWVHLFGEGKVMQPDEYPEVDGIVRLKRFKWGIGRILMETNKPPLIIPMWLTGFDKLMPEGRPTPSKFIPRPNVHLSVTFGQPVPAEELTAAPSTLGPTNPTPDNSSDKPRIVHGSHRVPHGDGWMGQAVLRSSVGLRGEIDEKILERSEELARVRSEVTAIIQRDVESLGRSVSGDKLGKGGS
ncbi:hypothetical protein JAAARDRAFT_155484 [Jaapia argillacea MUCL 33604]|uniref:Tafazzin family protein n=1 Tax=Jaapia argillacea MUCL 33604 TaxID=933084 RepID=A0A067PSS2_9AGAM|nr:hypothetical protein JAAARDRAFT_155484 [Jaapia argillacea MUCL 33604]